MSKTVDAKEAITIALEYLVELYPCEMDTLLFEMLTITIQDVLPDEMCEKLKRLDDNHDVYLPEHIQYTLADLLEPGES
jgi:hypothetical protein